MKASGRLQSRRRQHSNKRWDCGDHPDHGEGARPGPSPVDRVRIDDREQGGEHRAEDRVDDLQRRGVSALSTSSNGRKTCTLSAGGAMPSSTSHTTKITAAIHIGVLAKTSTGMSRSEPAPSWPPASWRARCALWAVGFRWPGQHRIWMHREMRETTFPVRVLTGRGADLPGPRHPASRVSAAICSHA